MSSENPTQEMPDTRSFEERVFARFDAIDNRLRSVDDALGDVNARLEKLESKQYDTKPIWEQALAEITETRSEMRTGFRKLERQLGILNGDLLELRAGVHDVETRLDRLERPPS